MASRSWNKVELMGNLTRDPELRFTPNGAAVCSFGVATNRSYVVEGERREEVDFHNIVAWNKLAELCNQLLKKGIKVFISGRLQYREWDNPEGQKQRRAEIVAEDMIIVSPKNPSSGVEYAENGPTEDVSTESTDKPAPKTATKAKESGDEKPAADDSAENPPVNEKVNDDDLPF